MTNASAWSRCLTHKVVRPKYRISIVRALAKLGKTLERNREVRHVLNRKKPNSPGSFPILAEERKKGRCQLQPFPSGHLCRPLHGKRLSDTPAAGDRRQASQRERLSNALTFANKSEGQQVQLSCRKKRSLPPPGLVRGRRNSLRISCCSG